MKEFFFETKNLHVFCWLLYMSLPPPPPSSGLGENPCKGFKGVPKTPPASFDKCRFFASLK